MSGFCEHKVGEWVKGCGYYHQCPICKGYFWGRKNKVFCDPKCKGKVASENHSELNKEYGKYTREMIRNAEILKKFYPGANNLTPVSIIKLRKSGFIDSGLQKVVKFPDFEGVWHQIGNYAFQLDETKQNIFIIKI